MAGETIAFRVPGKVVVNGSYIVLSGETCRVVAIKAYMVCKATRTASSKAVVTVEVDGGMMARYCHEDRLLDDASEPSCYLLRVVCEFFRATGVVPRGQIDIRMRAQKGFFVDGPSSEKTGIGSSACILVSIVYALLRFHQEEVGQVVQGAAFKGWGEFPLFEGDLGAWLGGLGLSKEVVEHLLPITYLTHQRVCQGASGCDVMCCLLGSILFSRRRCVLVTAIPEHLALGSFGKSTATREMLGRVRLGGPGWESLKSINKRLNKEQGNPKALFVDYLRAMRAISTAIVPERQYGILMRTSSYDIWGCGISGAGGDDCVWALADDCSTVLRYWREAFTFTFVAEVSAKGIELL